MELALSITGHYEPHAQDRNVTSVTTALSSPGTRSLLSAPSQMCSTILHLPCMLREGDAAKGALTLTPAGLGLRTGSAMYLPPDFKQVSSLL